MPAFSARRPLITAALALGATVLVATPALAAADPGDPRATAHDGNVTSCQQAGLPGTTTTSFGSEDPTHKFVTITPADIPSGVTILAVVVKGGPAYNVYQGLNSWTLLHSPVNRGGQIPTHHHDDRDHDHR